MITHSLKDEALIQVRYSKDMLGSIHKTIIEPFVINFGQYERVLLEMPQILKMYWNSIIIVVPIVGLQTLIGISAAYGFSKMKFKGSEILFFFYIIIMLMPFQVTLVSNYLILNKLNLINHYGAIILPGIFSTFSTFFLKQFMEGIDDAFIEQSKLEGATDLQVLVEIITPMCKPIIVAVLVLLFIDYWNMVEQPIIFLSSTEKHPLSIYLLTIMSEHIGISFACCVLYLILPLCLVMYAQNDLSESFTITSLK